MSLRRRWVAECDEPGCGRILMVPPDPSGDDAKADAGMYINDHDWDAAPGRSPTICPEHRAAARATHTSADSAREERP